MLNTNTCKLNCAGTSLPIGGFSRCNYLWITEQTGWESAISLSLFTRCLSPHVNLSLHLVQTPATYTLSVGVPHDGKLCNNHSTHIPLNLGYVIIILLQTITNIIQIITFKTRFSFNMTDDRPSFITSIMKLKNKCVTTQLAFAYSHFQKPAFHGIQIKMRRNAGWSLILVHALTYAPYWPNRSLTLNTEKENVQRVK
jgi:hypothetical protein